AGGAGVAGAGGAGARRVGHHHRLLPAVHRVRGGGAGLRRDGQQRAGLPRRRPVLRRADGRLRPAGRGLRQDPGGGARHRHVRDPDHGDVGRRLGADLRVPGLGARSGCRHLARPGLAGGDAGDGGAARLCRAVHGARRMALPESAGLARLPQCSLTLATVAPLPSSRTVITASSNDGGPNLPRASRLKP
nr:hypothetical protein [Tanacetum cinerariifolium]